MRLFESNFMKNFLGRGHSPGPLPLQPHLDMTDKLPNETKIGTPHFVKQSYASDCPGHVSVFWLLCLSPSTIVLDMSVCFYCSFCLHIQLPWKCQSIFAAFSVSVYNCPGHVDVFVLFLSLSTNVWTG